MPSDSAATLAASSEVNGTTPELDVSKRDAADGDADAGEPPSKKARLEEQSETNQPDHSDRDRGIAPIKAEYASTLAFSRIEV